MESPKEQRIDLRSLPPREIDRFCTETLGQKSGQGLRVAVEIYRKRVGSITAMGLNKRFRGQLAEQCTLSRLDVIERNRSEDGTEKLLYRLADGNAIEGVLIPGPGGRLTLCVSSQVGCASGCAFCLTGTGGLVRNLTAAEMTGQVFAAQEAASGAVSNIVLMGTGEPLANYDTVRTFIAIATDRDGFAFSPRKVTVSTCGLVPAIERLAADQVDASLAVSLNATTDELRDRLMPVNRTYPLARLLAALRSYCATTGRTVTIEYVLFKDLNDSVDDARRLMALLDGLPCMINLLLFNPYPGAALERPDESRVFSLRDLLVNAGFVTVVRNSRGRDIGAACGQLRAAHREAREG